MPVPRWKVMLANVLDRVMPALPFRSGLDPAHLSRDPDIVQAYRADPLVHGSITPRLFAETARAMGLVLQRSERISKPVLFFLGSSDRIVDTDRTVRFAESMSGVDVTIRIHQGAYHELLQEVDRPRVYREIRDWIATRL
jgi:alpha-beta hydrolase superfamily lysophospholipase